MSKEICRLVFRHDKETDILTVICSRPMDQELHEVIKENHEIEFLQGNIKVKDTWNDEGDLFKNCSVLTMKISWDKIQPVFDKMSKVFREQISASIGHTNN